MSKTVSYARELSVSRLMSEHHAYARFKSGRPKYCLHIPDGGEILELGFKSVDDLWSEAADRFKSETPPPYMEIRYVREKGFLQFHKTRITRDDLQER